MIRPLPSHITPESPLTITEKDLGTKPYQGCQQASPDFDLIRVTAAVFRDRFDTDSVIPGTK